jgi:hypothetical protein
MDKNNKKKKKKKKRESLKDLDAAILQHLYKSFVIEGHIDPRRKSEVEIEKEFRIVAKKFAKQKKIYGIIVHHEDLLKEARKYKKIEKSEMACLFYATWFEHWINNILLTQCRKTSMLDNDEAKLLIRDCSLRVKYTCLPTMLGLPPLAEKHISVAFRISELRNAFVHYKFTPVDLDEDTRDEDAWKRDFERSEAAVKYLQRYELRNVYGDSKEKAKKFLKG